jgi:hypothetical protein
MPEQFSTHAAEPTFQLAFEDPYSYEIGNINIAGSGSESNAYGINTDPTPVQVTQDVVYGGYVLPAVMVRYRTVPYRTVLHSKPITIGCAIFN